MTKLPLIIDVDTGLDDALCIIAASKYTEQLDIHYICAVAGNNSLENTSRNTLNLVDAIGFQVDVAKGCDSPLKQELVIAGIHGDTGIGKVQLPRSNRAFVETKASELIYQEAIKYQGKLNILATGPLTDVAEAIIHHPDIIDIIEHITIMGGSSTGGNVSAVAEFNIKTDPEAAKIVFNSGIPLTMIGLDVTMIPCMTNDFITKVEALHTPLSDIVTEINYSTVEAHDTWGEKTINIHDVIAFASIVKPELFTYKMYYADIETEGTLTRGMTVIDLRNATKKKPNVNVATDIDAEGFWNWLYELIKQQ